MTKIFLSLLAISIFSHAQVYTQPANTSPKATNKKTAHTSNNNESDPLAFGEEIPILNPGNETITIGGLTIPLGDNRVIRSRFEKYLNQPAEDIAESIQYHATLDKIISLLAPRPGQPPRQEKIEEAFALLPEAASYPGDAKLCQSLAETIYASLQAKRDIRQMKALNSALDKRRVQLATKADFMKSTANSSSLGESKKLGESNQASKTAKKTEAKAEVVSSQRYLHLIKEITEIEVSKKKHLIQSEQQILQTKIQYQATMMQWLLQRRFHHLIIAARFYNVLWQDGDNALHIDNNATISKLFSNSLGFSPTVTALDSIANEAVRDTENAVNSCIYMMDNADLHTASKRLLEAFAVGEFLTPVASFDISRKRIMQLYIRDLSMLFDAVQAKDYGRARELTVELKKKAKDFPSSKAESTISANTIASNMAISSAQKAFINEDEEGVVTAIQRATELWPTNPKLADFSKQLDTGTTVNVARKDFKRLIQEGNYREIYKRQYEFAPAIANQPEDLAAFKEIMSNLGKIEMAIEKAKSFSKAGNSYAAWEQLAELRENFPDDPKLGRELELLAPKVADFTKALNIAEELENRTPQQTGSAISHYLQAKSIYPSSEFAASALERLIDQTLGSGKE